MLMIYKLRKRFHTDTSGSTYFDFMIQFFICICIIATLVHFYNIFVVHQNMVFVAKRIVRAIEVEGANNAGIQLMFNRLRNEVGLGTATLQVIPDTPYLPGGGNRIQLRNTFEVRVAFNWMVTFIDIGGGGRPIGVPMNLEVRLSGMSEVFWRL